MNDGVDGGGFDDLGDHRISDVRSDELRVADVAGWWNDIDSDDTLNVWVLSEQASQTAAQVARDTGDEHDARHGDLPSGGSCCG